MVKTKEKDIELSRQISGSGSNYLKDESVPVVSSTLHTPDFLGAVMVRWGINRNNYRITPGLYSIGSPDSSSDVFVTANYKLSFDSLRKNLGGINGWILVLDTKGVNVWCAAGKGTFGTKELVARVKETNLGTIVNHRRLILPQLGATGVAAHKVKEESGFNVHYGPVRAADIKAFIAAGYRASGEMRKVTFNFRERIKLIPNDFIYGKFYLLGALAVIFLQSLITSDGINFRNAPGEGITGMLLVLLAYFTGIVITPALLPWVPFRRFALKGFVTGIILWAALFLTKMTGDNILINIAWFLLLPAISSFLAMNFTGSSTFTSLSGVKKEMKTAVPLQIIFSVVGVILMFIGKFIN
jgi:hypothetical protein